MEKHINDTIIAYLNDPDNQELAQAVESWLNASADNRQLFAVMQQVWESAGQLPQEFSVQEGWESLTAQLGIVAPPPPVAKVKSMYRIWWRVAAVVLPLLVLTGAWYGYHSAGAEWHTFTASKNGIDSVSLEDGSKVILRPGTGITWRLGKSQREVRMQQGEAFLKVAKDAKRAFTVQLPTGTVTVLGTSFNIKATPTYSDVAVWDGRVSVAGSKGQPILLTAGGLAIIDTAGRVSQPTGHYAYRGSWSNRNLRFHEKNLEVVLRTMETIYHIKIAVMDAKLLAFTVSLDVSDVSANEALQILSFTLGTGMKQLSDSTYQLGTAKK
ncbi:MAG: FecR domain-containing protein [Chitinophaga sp.]|uniref:FecR family protein n=1 Tax=Chitinophaga sp. TaxID=1869181 RepID=UPI0025B9F149|nr:FecR family protein [Chitinophaga sp.]MBV8253113.1 FecR domain-containing protein [Chitinophaga sp.]